LTDPGALPSEVLTELKRSLGAPSGEPVYIAGGTKAVSAAIDATLVGEGYTNVVRFAGVGRNHTAALVAEEIIVRNPSPTTSVLLSENRAFADVLGAGSAAGSKNSVGNVRPIMLTERGSTTLDGYASDYLRRHTTISSVGILGGTKAVSQAVADTLGDDFPQVTTVSRTEGADRFATNAAFNAAEFPSPTIAVVASGVREALPGAVATASSTTGGTGFFGALLAGTIGARLRAPTVLTQPGTLPAPSRQYIADHAATLTQAFIIGNTAAVSSAVESEVASLL
jgi:putative cell wall-binding protein